MPYTKSTQVTYGNNPLKKKKNNGKKNNGKKNNGKKSK